MMTKIFIGMLGVIALLVFAMPTPAVAACAAVCPNAVERCPACTPDAPYCLDDTCVPPAKIIGTTIDIEFGAPTSTTTFSDFLCNIVGFINKDILPPIAVFMTLLAGFFFMLSGQDPQKATTARRIVLYTVIGVALFIIAPGIIALIASVLGAAPGTFAPVACSSTMTADSVTKTIVNLVNWFAWFIALVSVAMGLYAGFLYITSRGDSRQTQQAAKTLSYTIIGIAVSVLAFSIISLVKAFLG